MLHLCSFCDPRRLSMGRKECDGSCSPLQEQVASAQEIGGDLEEVEVMQKKFDDFKADLKANESRLAEMNQVAYTLSSVGQTAAAQRIQQQVDVSLNSLLLFYPFVS